MELSRNQIHSVLLAGTVAVPPTFPELGVLTFHRDATAEHECTGLATNHVLTVEQRLSPKLVMTRTFLAHDVAAVFIPDDPSSVDLRKGRWLLGAEIATIDKLSQSGSPIAGIAYVREQAGTLLHVEIGMTAAESAEYYPPLPDDRSVNHYRFENPVAVQSDVADCNFGSAGCN